MLIAGAIGVNMAGFANSLLFNRFQDIFRDRLDPGKLEVAGSGENKISGYPALQVFVHVKSVYKGDNGIEQDHRQGQGQDGDKGFPFGTPQVGKRHFLHRAAVQALIAFGGTGRTLGIAERLHRGNPGGKSSGTGAGKMDSNQGKQGCPYKDNGVKLCRDNIHSGIADVSYNNWGQPAA